MGYKCVEEVGRMGEEGAGSGVECGVGVCCLGSAGSVCSDGSVGSVLVVASCKWRWSVSASCSLDAQWQPVWANTAHISM